MEERGILSAEEVAERMEGMKPRLLAYAHQRFRLGRDDAEDAYQMAALGLCRYGNISAGGKPDGYIVRAFSNACRQFLAREHYGWRARAYLSEDAGEGIESRENPLDALLLKEAAGILREDIARLKKAIGSLSLPSQQILYLRVAEGLEDYVTEALLGLKSGAAKMRMFRAKTRLRKALSEGNGSWSAEEISLLRGENDTDAGVVIEGLAPKFGKEVALRYRGLTYKEVARRRRIPPGTARSRVASGKAALEKALDLA